MMRPAPTIATLNAVDGITANSPTCYIGASYTTVGIGVIQHTQLSAFIDEENEDQVSQKFFKHHALPFTWL